MDSATTQALATKKLWRSQLKSSMFDSRTTGEATLHPAQQLLMILLKHRHYMLVLSLLWWSIYKTHQLRDYIKTVHGL